MPLANTTQLISDIKEIMDNPPSGGVDSIAEAWAHAIANWLTTVNSPPVEALTSDALSAAMKPILSVDFTLGGTTNPPAGTPDFIDLINLALVAGSGVILLDPLVAPLVTAGTVIPPINSVSFNAAKTIGMAGGGSSAIATSMATELVTWSLSGVSPAGTWL